MSRPRGALTLFHAGGSVVGVGGGNLGSRVNHPTTEEIEQNTSSRQASTAVSILTFQPLGAMMLKRRSRSPICNGHPVRLHYITLWYIILHSIMLCYVLV